jgi:hypothetical protein
MKNYKPISPCLTGDQDDLEAKCLVCKADMLLSVANKGAIHSKAYSEMD